MGLHEAGFTAADSLQVHQLDLHCQTHHFLNVFDHRNRSLLCCCCKRHPGGGDHLGHQIVIPNQRAPLPVCSCGEAREPARPSASKRVRPGVTRAGARNGGAPRMRHTTGELDGMAQASSPRRRERYASSVSCMFNPWAAYNPVLPRDVIPDGGCEYPWVPTEHLLALAQFPDSRRPCGQCRLVVAQHSLQAAGHLGFPMMLFNLVVSTLPAAFHHKQLGYIDALVIIQRLVAGPGS